MPGKRRQNKIAMAATPIRRLISLARAAPAAPMAGSPKAPLMKMALSTILSAFTATEIIMLSFIIWLLRKKAVKVRYTAWSSIPTEMMRV